MCFYLLLWPLGRGNGPPSRVTLRLFQTSCSVTAHRKLGTDTRNHLHHGNQQERPLRAPHRVGAQKQAETETWHGGGGSGRCHPAQPSAMGTLVSRADGPPGATGSEGRHLSRPWLAGTRGALPGPHRRPPLSRALLPAPHTWPLATPGSQPVTRPRPSCARVLGSFQRGQSSCPETALDTQG